MLSFQNKKRVRAILAEEERETMLSLWNKKERQSYVGGRNVFPRSLIVILVYFGGLGNIFSICWHQQPVGLIEIYGCHGG